MAARRVPALALPVDPQAGVSFRGYEHRTPLLTIATGRPLAAKAWAYAVAVERRYRGLPPLPDAPVPPALWAGPDTWTGDPHRQALAPVPGRQEETA
jgi:hypothetical protein